MKKIIPVLLALLTLSSCAQRVKAPDLNESFNVNAVYKSGDYSYACKIVKDKNGVSITPTSTNAAGMRIYCNGKTVEFTYGDFKKISDINKLDKTNPAIILYEVFFSGASSGNTSVGSFTLKSENGLPVNIDIPDADITLSFN